MHAADSADLQGFDPFDPSHLASPSAGWALMRRGAPIYRLQHPGTVPVFIVSRKRDIERIAEQTALFSNNPVPTVWRWGEFEPAIAEVFARSGFRVVHTLQASDPPDSLRYRDIVEAALGRRKIAALAPEISRICAELLDAIPEGEAINFVDAFSVPLPLQVICRILGLPLEDANFIRVFSDEFTHLIDPTHSLERAIRATETVVDGYRYLAALMTRYEQEPADNLLSTIAHGTVDGRPLTPEEKVSMAQVLTIAGNETTRNALSAAVFELAQRPDLWARLQARPDRVPDFIEEVLRVHAPATTTPRMVREDTVFEGVHMPKGSAVFLLWGSASQDEAEFDEPLQIDLDRKNKSHHLSFGFGVHRCVGAMLARAELKAAITLWLRELKRVQLVLPVDQVQRDPVFGFHAFSRLPIRIYRRARGAATPDRRDSAGTLE